MTAFRDMTRAELEDAMADELREFILDIDAPADSAELQAQITQFMVGFDRHFEVVAHPPTEGEKAARFSARMELRAKTAWGHLEMVRRGYEEAPR